MDGAWEWAEACTAAGDAVQAVRWARWAAALAPAEEAVIRRLMTFFRGQGDRAAALRAYEVFVATLVREFELEPSAETRALADAIRLEHPPAPLKKSREARPPRALGGRPEQSRSRRSGLVGALIGAALVAIVGLRAVVPRAGRDAPAPAIRRIAVLPLQNLTGDSTQDYFVDGMHEALIDELAKIKAASVISRTSVVRFRGTARPSLPEIARQLGVDAVVEGSVLRVRDSVRIAIQLIDGRTDQHLWSETYLRDLHDVLGLYGELATDVAERIRIVVTPTERGRLAGARRVDPEVYFLVLKGQNNCQLWTEEGERVGILSLRLVIDPHPDPSRPRRRSLAYATRIGNLFRIRPAARVQPRGEGGDPAGA